MLDSGVSSYEGRECEAESGEGLHISFVRRDLWKVTLL